MKNMSMCTCTHVLVECDLAYAEGDSEVWGTRIRPMLLRFHRTI